MQELLAAAQEADNAAIVVGFEYETRFVWSGNIDAARQLEALLAIGGCPVAVLGAKVAGNAFLWCLDPFEEYAEDKGVRNYLQAIGNTVVQILEQRLAAAAN